VLRSIAGIVQPTAGTITIGGHDLERHEVAAKRSLGFVPEVPNPYELLTVWEHLEFVARVYDRLDGFAARAEELLLRLNLAEKRKELVVSLSKGMKQKLTIACAMVHDPPLLMLDEPIIGIDPKGQREVKSLLRETRAEGRAVLISTHILATAEELCDHVLILHRGRVAAEGTLDEIHAGAGSEEGRTLEDLFLVLTAEGQDAAAPES
jgi:ABC-2 type transport system ATP-binding protein